MPPKTRPPREKKDAIDPADYVPACVEACPTGAIMFGDLADPNSAVAQAAQIPTGIPPARKTRHADPKCTTGRTGRGCGRSPKAARPRRRRCNMASAALTDRRWIARGVDRAPTSRFALLAGAVGTAACLRRLRRRALPALRSQPDQHGQPLPVRSVDLPGPIDHRARRRRVLYGLPGLHTQDQAS